MSSRAGRNSPRIITVHPESPQLRLLQNAIDAIQSGAIVALPTESGYALTGQLTASCAQTLRRMRDLDERHPLTLLCANLSVVGHMAHVDNAQHRILKRALPGPYTFILPSGADMPRRITHPKLKTVGIRVPSHKVAQVVCAQIEGPLLSATAIAPGESNPLSDPQALHETFGAQLDCVIESGQVEPVGTTVIDLTTAPYGVLRKGAVEDDFLKELLA